MCLPFAGDIAFRFLEYVRNQSVERDIQRGGTAAKGDGETGESLYQASSHVTVCDINQAMLDVGKSKALDRGQTGNLLSNIVTSQYYVDVGVHDMQPYYK